MGTITGGFVFTIGGGLIFVTAVSVLGLFTIGGLFFTIGLFSTGFVLTTGFFTGGVVGLLFTVSFFIGGWLIITGVVFILPRKKGSI